MHKRHILHRQMCEIGGSVIEDLDNMLSFQNVQAMSMNMLYSNREWSRVVQGAETFAGTALYLATSRNLLKRSFITLCPECMAKSTIGSTADSSLANFYMNKIYVLSLIKVKNNLYFSLFNSSIDCSYIYVVSVQNIISLVKLRKLFKFVMLASLANH